MASDKTASDTPQPVRVKDHFGPVYHLLFLFALVPSNKTYLTVARVCIFFIFLVLSGHELYLYAAILHEEEIFKSRYEILCFVTDLVRRLIMPIVVYFWCILRWRNLVDALQALTDLTPARVTRSQRWWQWLLVAVVYGSTLVSVITLLMTTRSQLSREKVMKRVSDVSVASSILHRFISHALPLLTASAEQLAVVVATNTARYCREVLEQSDSQQHGTTGNYEKIAWQSDRNDNENLLTGDIPDVTEGAWTQSSPHTKPLRGLPFRYPISLQPQSESTEGQRYNREVKRLREKLANMKAKFTGLNRADMVDSFRSDDIIRFEKTVGESSENLTKIDMKSERNRKPFHKHMQTVPYNKEGTVHNALRTINTHTNTTPTPFRKKKVQFIDPEYENSSHNDQKKIISTQAQNRGGPHSFNNDQKVIVTRTPNHSHDSHSVQVRKFVVQLLTESGRKVRLANRFLRHATEALTLAILVTLAVALFTIISDTLVLVSSPLADYHYLEKTKDLMVALVHIVFYCWPPRNYHRQVRMLSESSLTLGQGERWGLGELVTEVGERHGPLSVGGFFTLAPNVITSIIGFCLIYSMIFFQLRQI